MLDLMFITNEPQMAENAERAGIGRIFIDLESQGKRERQKNKDTYISDHSLKDINSIHNVIKKIPIMVRVNPYNENSIFEIEECIVRGADILMLPMFSNVDEVDKIVKIIRGRTKLCLLLETPQALVRIHDIVKIAGIDEIHIGLNDLHLGMQLDFMFELLNGGIIDYLAEILHKQKIKFGFGGIAKIGQGIIPAEVIIGEHYRLGSQMTILSRAFRKDADTFIKLNKEIEKIRKYESIVKNWSREEFEKNKFFLDFCIKEYLARQGKNNEKTNSGK